MKSAMGCDECPIVKKRVMFRAPRGPGLQGNEAKRAMFPPSKSRVQRHGARRGPLRCEGVPSSEFDFGCRGVYLWPGASSPRVRVQKSRKNPRKRQFVERLRQEGQRSGVLGAVP